MFERSMYHLYDVTCLWITSLTRIISLINKLISALRRLFLAHILFVFTEQQYFIIFTLDKRLAIIRRFYGCLINTVDNLLQITDNRL